MNISNNLLGAHKLLFVKVLLSSVEMAYQYYKKLKRKQVTANVTFSFFTRK